MNKNTLTALLDDLRALILKSRPAYRDFLGEVTETKTTKILENVVLAESQLMLPVADAAFSGFISGEAYRVMLNGEEKSVVAADFSGVVILSNVNVEDFSNPPNDYWALQYDSVKEKMIAGTSGAFLGATISVYYDETVTTQKWSVKKLAYELLPDRLLSALSAAADTARKALTAANAAHTTANAANTTANNAQTTANNAQTTANTAKTTADNAQSTANAAQSTANTAKTTAENAQSTANAAQSTANAAQSTANAAQSTAESIKPNWNENNSSKPRYIANRPFYHDIITAEIPNGYRTPSAKLLIDGTELYWSDLVSNLTNLLKINENKIYMLDGTLEKFTPICFRTGVNSYYYDYALGNPHLIKAKLPSAKDEHGGELPDTGGDWVYYHTPGNQAVVTISKTNGWYGTFVEFLSEDLKLLDEKFIPASIQRTGGEVFLHSSTPNSTKKFKITVDDSGALSATEVTDTTT